MRIRELRCFQVSGPAAIEPYGHAIRPALHVIAAQSSGVCPMAEVNADRIDTRRSLPA